MHSFKDPGIRSLILLSHLYLKNTMCKSVRNAITFWDLDNWRASIFEVKKVNFNFSVEESS